MEMILIPNCSLLYLHSNDTNSLKFILEKKEVIAINIIVIKQQQMKSDCNRLSKRFSKQYYRAIGWSDRSGLGQITLRGHTHSHKCD